VVKFQIVVHRPAVVHAKGQHGSVLAGTGMVQGAWGYTGLGQGLGRGPVQGRVAATAQRFGLEVKPGQNARGKLHLEVLAG